MPKERLDSWKAIAEYLERSLRTVQRWHSHHGLPVHRFGGVKGAVFAYPEEIDRWLVSLARETRERGATEGEALAASQSTSAELTRTANQMWEARSERNIQTVAALYRKAIDHDPSNGDALEGLANTMIFATVCGILEGAVAYPSAQDVVRRIGPPATGQTVVRCAVPWLDLLYGRDWERARAGFEAVLLANPENTFALAGRSMLHIAEGELDEACAVAWTAWRKKPLASSLNSLLCWVHALAGDSVQALDLIEQVKMSGSCNSMVAAAEGYTLLSGEEPEMQLARMEQLAAQNPGHPTIQGMLGYLYGTVGRTTSALEILYAFDRMSRLKKRANGYALALVHLGLGNRGAALECLEAAYAEGSIWSLALGHDLLLASLREESGFDWMMGKKGAAAKSQAFARD